LFKSSQKDRSHHFWKRNARSIELYDDVIFQQKVDYIHLNPLKAGLCNLSEEYIYSSARYYQEDNFSYGVLTHYRAVGCWPEKAQQRVELWIGERWSANKG